ncbi:MAG: DNA polymerase IV [Neisseriaceae bacterium]|nr:DNA polymerase IV [Neisseriaceae bacterium]
MSPSRKIIHIDMDAFYASVELRDAPHLRGKPVVVAWDASRSVICAASYEARAYGLRSAMSVGQAKKLCPHAIYIPPNFHKYHAVSQQVQAIFKQHTDLIEPLSLDEAYLDVTHNKQGYAVATELAAVIRQQIFDATGLTASAGIAPNKFLAKIASDWRKPNGQFVVKPHHIQTFLKALPLDKVPGVGKVTLNKLHQLGYTMVSDLHDVDVAQLMHYFGRYGYRLHQLAQGIDHRPVEPNQVRQQVSKETTFNGDLTLAEAALHLPELMHDLWRSCEHKAIFGRSLTLKLKTHQFQSITRSLTFDDYITQAAELTQGTELLLSRLDLPASQRYRLIGLGLSLFADGEHPPEPYPLFED